MRSRWVWLAVTVVGLIGALTLTACGKPTPTPRVATPTAGPPLTAVAGAAPVWAVGWTEIVLNSTDGGATWSTKHQGSELPDMLFGVAVHGRQVFAGGPARHLFQRRRRRHLVEVRGPGQRPPYGGRLLRCATRLGSGGTVDRR